MDKNQNDHFTYTYSAPTAEERREIDGIRRQYLQPDGAAERLEELRALDRRVKSPAICISLSLGVVGSLIFGLGMSMSMAWAMLAWGIVVAIVGIGLIALARPAYRIILKRNKVKYGDKILRLSEELLNENNGKPSK